MLEYFPDNYSWSQSVNICLSAGGQINEIDEACAPLKEISKHKDDAAQKAWHENWKRLANRVEELASHDEEAGHYLSAGGKYLRATSYYIMAERMVNNRDPQKLETYAKVLSTFKKGIQLGRYPVEFVDIPYNNTALTGLFVPALGGENAPCMIHFDGFDGFKEMLYLCIPNEEFRNRGVALLIIDHPGVGEALRLRNLHLNPFIEGVASASMNYLEGRSEVDPKRIGIIGISLGGYYAPRAAAFEKRLKCCVAWGGIWNYREAREWRMSREKQPSSVPPFQLLWVTGKDTVEEANKVIDKMTLEGVADKITCPLLVVHGENDQLIPLIMAERTIDAAINSPARKLKVFTHKEGGTEHVQVDNMTLAVDYISDWVAETLGGNPKGV
ncbi:alpha/beta hydrolase family protein [Thermodesulfobacteriota bacterium]